MNEADKSSLVILVPHAEALVGDLRGRYDVAGISGLPAHVTVLFPFAHPDALSSTLTEDLTKFFGSRKRFSFGLAGVCGFPRVVYLAPEPMAPFDALTRATHSRFPEFPPYGGIHESPVPHLTIAQQPPADDLETITSALTARIATASPLACVANDVALAVKRAGRWSIRERFALA